MNGKPYVVTIVGRISVDTTVAVIAESKEEAARRAVHGVLHDTTEWLHHESLEDDPVVFDVSEETWDELQYANQKHLLGPRLH